MNVIQASILNNYCEEHPEVLMVFVQANNSLSVYYRNKNNKIAHKFGSVKRSSELEAEQVWVSLQNFDDNYKDLLKYFHPDTYKGKRKNYELTQAISVISQIRGSKSFINVRDIHGLLSTVDNRPEHELSNKSSELPSFPKSLGSQRWFNKCKDWVQSFGWSQNNLYSSDDILQYI